MKISLFLLLLETNFPIINFSPEYIYIYITLNSLVDTYSNSLYSISAYCLQYCMHSITFFSYKVCLKFYLVNEVIIIIENDIVKNIKTFLELYK